MDFLLLKLGDQIQGDATLEGYAGQIEVLSFSHGIAQPILHDLISRHPAGRPTHQEFTVTKHLDRATTGIIAACDRATTLPEAILTFMISKSGEPQPLWVVTLKNVLVSSISFAGGGGGRPVESLTLNYTAIHWFYNGTTTSGQPASESTSWNLATNKEDV